MLSVIEANHRSGKIAPVSTTLYMVEILGHIAQSGQPRILHFATYLEVKTENSVLELSHCMMDLIGLKIKAFAIKVF